MKRIGKIKSNNERLNRVYPKLTGDKEKDFKRIFNVELSSVYTDRFGEGLGLNLWKFEDILIDNFCYKRDGNCIHDFVIINFGLEVYRFIKSL